MKGALPFPHSRFRIKSRAKGLQAKCSCAPCAFCAFSTAEGLLVPGWDKAAQPNQSPHSSASLVHNRQTAAPSEQRPLCVSRRQKLHLLQASLKMLSKLKAVPKF